MTASVKKLAAVPPVRTTCSLTTSPTSASSHLLGTREAWAAFVIRFVAQPRGTDHSPAPAALHPRIDTR